MSDTAGYSVDFFASEESLARLEESIARAIGAAFQSQLATSKFADMTTKVNKAVVDGANKATTATKGGVTAQKELNAVLTKSERQAANYVATLRDLGNALGAIVAASNRVRTNERQAAIAERNLMDRQLQERIALIERDTKLQAQAARTTGELQVNAAKVSGKQRVQITRAVLESLTRLEKAGYSALTGAAKSAASALSRIGSTISSVLRRSNSSFNDGLSSSLRTRESTISNSFTRQERELRQSVLRQERQLTILRQQTSRGVLGAVTGRGVGVGIAGLVGGVGVAQLASAGYADAVNFGEQVNKNKVVFGEFIGDILAFTSQAPKLLGSTQAAALEATGTFGNLFRSLGIGQTQAGMFSIALTQTAADLSSFNNVPVEDAFLALRSGLVGESEPLRKFGIDVSDARLRHEAFLLGISDGKSVLTASQKVQAAYAAIIKDSSLAQGDFARTAEEGANAARVRQASILQLVSTLERKFLPIVTAVNLALSSAAQGLTAFAEGRVSGALLIVRDALKGAAIGLAAVAAAKGGVEVLRLLAVASKLLFTPMGAVLVAAGLLGAAISVLVDRSEPLRLALKGLWERFGLLVDRVRGNVTPFLERFSSFVSDTAAPAVARFADFLGNNLLKAFDATVRFVTTKAIPAVQDFAGFVRDKLGVAWEFVSEKVGGFITKVMPFLQPAIAGFSSLGDAIGRAFGGDFTGLRTGAANALGGIGATVAGIAAAVGTALLPVARQVLGFFTDLFSGPNLAKYASAILGFVEGAGRILGQIASSPILLKVAAGLAAAAAVLAFTFVKGFASGVIDNIPELLSTIGDALVAGLKLAFSNPLVVLGALALAPLGLRLAKMFKGFGEMSGKEFTSGLKGGFSNARGFLSGAFGGTSGAVTAAARQANKDFNKQLQDLTNKTRILGGDQTLVSPRTIDAAKAQIRQLSEGLSESAIAGLAWRDKMQQASIAVRTGFQGLGQIGRGAAQLFAAPFVGAVKGYIAALKATDIYAAPGTSGGKAFTGAFMASVKGAGGGIAAGFSAVLGSLKTYADSQGISVGRALGQAVTKGAQIGLAAVGGFQAGAAEGAAGGSGLTSILTAGLTGLAVGGPVTGAVAAGAAYIGAAFGRAGAAAKAMKERVGELTRSLRDELKKAADDGTLSVIKLGKGLIDFGDIGGLDSTTKAVQDALGSDGVAAIALFGLTWESNIKPIFDAGGDLDVMKDKLRDVFFGAATGSDEFVDRFSKVGVSAQAVADILRRIAAPGGDANIRDFINNTTFDGGPLLDALVANEDFLNNLLDTSGDLTRVAEETKKAIDNVNNVATAFGVDVSAKPIVGQIDIVEGRLTEMSVIVAGIDSQFRNLFNPDYSNTQAIVDSGVIQAASLGQQRQSIKETGGVAQQASTNQNVAQVGDLLANALAQGIDAGAIVDATSASAFVQPIIDAYVAGITDPKEAALIREFLEGQVPKISPLIDPRIEANAAIALETEINKLLETLPSDVEISYDTAKSLVNADLTVADINSFIANNPSLAGLTYDQVAARLVAQEQHAAYAQEFEALPAATAPIPFWDALKLNLSARLAGEQVSIGFAAGINSKEYLALRAASDLANNTIHAANGALQVKSPSRVFIAIGRYVSEGLAIGITDGASQAAAAVDAAIDKMLVAARSGGSQIADAMRQAGVSLFGALTGSGAALNTSSPLSTAQAGVTSAIQSLLSTFDSNTTTVFDIAKKKDKDRSLADKNILGESLFSLSALDVIGASNLAALTDAFDAIAGLGETLLTQGDSAESVAARLQKEVDALIATAIGLGFNADEVGNLADALGLSRDALAGFVDELNGISVDAAQTSLPSFATPKPIRDPRRRPEITNNIYLPSGDARAAALAVANRQAATLFG